MPGVNCFAPRPLKSTISGILIQHTSNISHLVGSFGFLADRALCLSKIRHGAIFRLRYRLRIKSCEDVEVADLLNSHVSVSVWIIPVITLSL